MLTQDQTLEILADSLMECGPSMMMQGKDREGLLAEIREGLSEGNEESQQIAKFLMHMLNAAYTAGRESTVELLSRAIYEQWAPLPDYVPWVDRGNSLKQDKARELARKAMQTL